MPRKPKIKVVQIKTMKVGKVNWLAGFVGKRNKLGGYTSYDEIITGFRKGD